ncbi:MAG: DegT/DnrJ/EryC1/StrS family aminotransferase [Candidatus Aenigmarchaeota archaeon]|nr:DegT/DnrJ/EryC1/StrS family aminotransferase [Candidatus Aenigmarchaeota archaeon]
MNVPLSKPTITEDMKKRTLEVLESNRFVKGPNVEEFEKEFAKFCGVEHGTAVSNGTTAIYIALKALGIGKDDEVIVPSHSFVASASPILFVGAKPIFVDIGNDFLIDMDDLEKKITEKTKAVLCVHLYGQMCDMKKLMELKEKNKFFLIEDCCQAHGAEFDGKRAGSFGDASCFSFFPSKNITVAGDGGIIVTDNEELDAKLKILRDHGRDYRTKDGKFKSSALSLNFRMSEISAAIGREQLKLIDKFTERRKEIAKMYNEMLTGVVKPIEHEKRKHVYHLYVIRTEKQEELKNFLLENEIEAGIHYPIPIHKQLIFKEFDSELPETDKTVNEILSLPVFPLMTDEEVKFVSEKVNEFTD